MGHKGPDINGLGAWWLRGPNPKIIYLSNTLNDCVSGQTETSGRTAQPKVSIDNFHPIRILGDGGFGKVILVKKKSSDGTDQ